MAAKWFIQMTPQAQKEYLRKHPNSKQRIKPPNILNRHRAAVKSMKAVRDQLLSVGDRDAAAVAHHDMKKIQRRIDKRSWQVPKK